MPEKQKKTIRELTLMLMYLTSWEERDTPEEGLINAAGRTYPALITPEGEAEARKLLAQYGIDTEERRRCSAER